MYEGLSGIIGDLKAIYEKELEDAKEELEDSNQRLKSARIEMWVWGTVTVVSVVFLVILIMAFVE